MIQVYKRTRGVALPPHTKSVQRPSRWGNPFKVGVHGDAAQCVQKFKDWLDTGYAADAIEGPNREREMKLKRRIILTEVHFLKGYNLACCGVWIPGEPEIDCHAVELFKRANPELFN